MKRVPTGQYKQKRRSRAGTEEKLEDLTKNRKRADPPRFLVGGHEPSQK
jgi:hypothetical protein